MQKNVKTLSEKTLNAVAYIISGTGVGPGSDKISTYRTGPEIVAFFDEFGFNDAYANFGSRIRETQNRLRRLNGTLPLYEVIEAAVDPRAYIRTEFSVEPAVEFLNQYLRFDHLRPVKHGLLYKVSDDSGAVAATNLNDAPASILDYEYLNEQLTKADGKIASDDYDGAITNCRTLVEAVLRDLEKRLTATPVPADGDLQRQYKRVQKLLNLDPDAVAPEPLRMILRGFVSIVAGLAETRNKMSDSHAVEIRPLRHHAQLALNAAKTLCSFLVDSYQRQVERGKVTPPSP